MCCWAGNQANLAFTWSDRWHDWLSDFSCKIDRTSDRIVLWDMRPVVQLIAPPDHTTDHRRYWSCKWSHTVNTTRHSGSVSFWVSIGIEFLLVWSPFTNVMSGLLLFCVSCTFHHHFWKWWWMSPPLFPYTLGKSRTFLATRSVQWPKICRKCDTGRGSAPDPTGGAQDAPRDPLVGWGADTPPHTPLHLAPRCSRLQRLDRRAPWHQILETPLVTTTF